MSRGLKTPQFPLPPSVEILLPEGLQTFLPYTPCLLHRNPLNSFQPYPDPLDCTSVESGPSVRHAVTTVVSTRPINDVSPGPDGLGVFPSGPCPSSLFHSGCPKGVLYVPRESGPLGPWFQGGRPPRDLRTIPYPSSIPYPTVSTGQSRRLSSLTTSSTVPQMSHQ